MNKLQRERYKVWIGDIKTDARIWGQYERLVDFIYKVNSNIWTSGTNILSFVEKIKTMNNQII